MISLEKIEENYRPEMALTILILRVYFKRIKSGEIENYTLNRKINWKLFQEIIFTHQIHPVIYKVVSANESGFPVAILEKIRKKTIKVATGNLRYLEELVRLNKLLKEGGVSNIPYKGVILSWYIFKDFLSRVTSDIDFLIDKQSFAAAHKLLIDDGYEPKYYNPDFEQQILSSSHELMYKKAGPSGTYKIEIHWALTSKMMNVSLPNDFILNNPLSLLLMGENVAVLNIEKHLLAILVHHGINDAWRSLRHCQDIAALLDKYSTSIDWEEFHLATRKYRINHTTETGFRIAHELLGTEIPVIYNTKNGLNQNVLNNLLYFPALDKGKLNLENLKQQLFLRDSAGDRLKLLWCYLTSAFTPNVRDMEAFKVRKNRYFLYYFLKPCRILFNRRQVNKKSH